MKNVLILAALVILVAARPAVAGLTYVTGTVTFFTNNVIKLDNKPYRLLEKAPIRKMVAHGNSVIEDKGYRSDIRVGSLVTLHVAGHLIVDVMVERR